MEEYLRQYGLIAIFSLLAVLVPTGTLLISWLASFVRVRPRKPTPIKYSTYESGMETIGGRPQRFHVQYYMFALLFVVFDVEVVFIFPWAVRFNKLGLFALVEMLVFVGILVVGWLYAWRKGAFEWR